jgi:CubicO group peptidase (beta-lactamase class C family)
MKFHSAIYTSAIAICVASCLALSALAEGLPKASKPEDVGFSSERLKRIAGALQADVDKGVLPGAVVAIARNGKIAYLEAFGFQNRDKKIPMATDSIFRIASMSKPLTSVAIMMLMEEGKLNLMDPVSVYLPEFKNLKVGVEKTNSATGTAELSLEPVQREMTIQDLLRHTSGITYGNQGKSLVKDSYMAANVGDRNQTLAEFITKLSKLPLAYQPGTTWDYSMSTDVLGRVVEVVSGVSLDSFAAERIARPLGLADTGFYIAAEKAGRIAQPQVNPATGEQPRFFDPTVRPNWMSGGGGMVSTALDYVRFCQMLLDGGELDDVRLLSPRIVAYMTTDQLPPDIRYSPYTLQNFEPRGNAPTARTGQGFGLGFMIRTRAGGGPRVGSLGEYFWAGAYGTSFWIDPKEKLVVVLMTQSPGGPYQSLMRNFVYGALVN